MIYSLAMPRPGSTITPEPPRTVQAIVIDMAKGLHPRDIRRRAPWMNRANVTAYLRGGPIRMSERAIDQIIVAIVEAKEGARVE